MDPGQGLSDGNPPSGFYCTVLRIREKRHLHGVDGAGWPAAAVLEPAGSQSSRSAVYTTGSRASQSCVSLPPGSSSPSGIRSLLL